MAAVFWSEVEDWKREPEEVILLKRFASETGGVFAAFAWAGVRTGPDEKARVFFDSSLTYRLQYTLEYSAENSDNHEEWRKEGVRNIGFLRLGLKLRWENFIHAYAQLRTRFLLET